MEFLGKSAEYWIELDRRLREDEPNAAKLLVEVVKLRGLVNFYESRIAEMATIMRGETR